MPSFYLLLYFLFFCLLKGVYNDFIKLVLGLLLFCVSHILLFSIPDEDGDTPLGLAIDKGIEEFVHYS